jgi:hypothetical protein
MKRFIRLAAVSMAAVALMGCAASPDVKYTGELPLSVVTGQPFRVVVGEHGSAARTVQVSKGQELSVTWSADRQVTFIVYYNKGDDIFTTVSRQRAGSFRKSVVIEEDMILVFRWDNHTGNKVTVDCTISVAG